jgi:hypothetical protein
MIFANNEVRKQQRDLVNEFGVDFEDYGFTLQGGLKPQQSAQSAFPTHNVAWSANIFKPLCEDKPIFSKL